ncbi:hypothetical protein PUNSTDRAFT_140194 [Punctularia strigosozonata HHB-11173 SS5]|uniref:uncharacterized protein n=1 Tax=Punctularia strigosozonata (strain HHB-11173) TaxID=741275 RepID=UPI00044174A2|nr:uncharacterized protein PUNSTDRAFT_140194 [Punctularia strigosozonata HHB-11173 SS5]EIN13715.1 hypothetical protein PUNSTDRAFT_140194 [Punctularia strigosozonata HHB-11173 SS5]
MPVSELEKQREINIARNKARLLELNLEEAAFFSPGKTVKKKPSPRKRKEPSPDADYEEEESTKVSRRDDMDTPADGRRRSARNAGKKVDYKAEQAQSLRDPDALIVSRKSRNGPQGRPAGSKRIHSYKVYGSIPGIEVGTWWETREACSNDSIHAPWVAGICPGPEGAYSVALSGGYEDDVDMGYGFTYTGSGGRDLKGTKAKPKNLRTAPQSTDQSFEENNFNRALKRSAETGKPVRVIRGYKLPSKYGPEQGYRYDGLYKVEKAWLEEGLNPKRLKVCKFAFKRLPNQPPVPVKGEDVEIKHDEELKAEESSEMQDNEHKQCEDELEHKTIEQSDSVDIVDDENTDQVDDSISK